MILVCGASGTLGSRLVPALVGAGQQVRVLTRDARRVQHLSGDSVQVLVGDVRDREALRLAVAGASVAVSAVQGVVGPGRVSPASVDRDGNAALVDAARREGADVVLVSVVGAAPDSGLELFRMKAVAEAQLRASGAGWTVVRSSAFLETWIEILRRSGRSGRPVVLGRGDSPVNFVSASDVAAVIAAAVLDPGCRGRVLEIGGPQDLSLNQLASAVMAADGHPGSPRHVPPAALRVIGGLRPLATASRIARMALAMDRGPIAATPSAAALAPFPLPSLTAADLLAGRDVGRRQPR